MCGFVKLLEEKSMTYIIYRHNFNTISIVISQKIWYNIMQFDIKIRSVNIIMNIFTKRISILGLCALLMISAIGCSDDSEAGSDGTTNQSADDSVLASDVRDFLDELYLCFNEHRFDDYLTYLNITDDNMRANMLASLNNASQYYETVCVIEDIDVREFDDGLINVALSIVILPKQSVMMKRHR